LYFNEQLLIVYWALTNLLSQLLELDVRIALQRQVRFTLQLLLQLFKHNLSLSLPVVILLNIFFQLRTVKAVSRDLDF